MSPNAQERAEKIVRLFTWDELNGTLKEAIAAELDAYAEEKVNEECCSRSVKRQNLTLEYQQRITKIARAEEREACAKVCDSALECGCAERIRSRGEA